MLKDLSNDTAKYFMKAPPASIVEFALSRKAILVEGPSEYMLMERFYTLVTKKLPEDDDVHIIDVRGLSFKRYLDIAKQTLGKVAVVTDNDKNAQKHCIEKYSEYEANESIQVFFEKDNDKRTFEIVLYGDNKNLCDSLFGDNAQNFMLENKTEAAFLILSQDKSIVVPDYIERAIKWISE